MLVIPALSVLTLDIAVLFAVMFVINADIVITRLLVRRFLNLNPAATAELKAEAEALFAAAVVTVGVPGVAVPDRECVLQAQPNPRVAATAALKAELAQAPVSGVPGVLVPAKECVLRAQPNPRAAATAALKAEPVQAPVPGVPGVLVPVRECVLRAQPNPRVVATAGLKAELAQAPVPGVPGAVVPVKEFVLRAQ